MRFLIAFLFFQSIAWSATDPVGERAYYVVDTNPARTSARIKKGNFETRVTKFLSELESGPAYELEIDYQFWIQFMGLQSGIERHTIDEQYFSQEFLKKLRETGHYEGSTFKATHRGYADAKNLNGISYLNCDVLFLYDIVVTTDATGLARVMNHLLASVTGDESNKIEHLSALTHIYPGVPVLGAVKIDMAGTYQSHPVKVGGDYFPKE
jgi:hypothetical protein